MMSTFIGDIKIFSINKKEREDKKMGTAMNYIKAAVWGSFGLLIAMIVLAGLLYYAAKLPAPVGGVFQKAGTLTRPDGWGN
jgi:hypothetical protein